MKKKMVIIIAALLLGGGAMFTYGDLSVGSEVQKGIANSVIRFHVIANSDMKDDQELKIAVKDEVVKKLQGELSGAGTIENARKILRGNLGQIEGVAVKEMRKRGYSYGAKATLESSYFPVKMYGDMTFPEGEYEAVKVELGKAEGKNWWCVMYPTLCFVDSTYQVVPEESKDILKKDLTTEEYQSLLRGENVTYGFKLLEWVENLFR